VLNTLAALTVFNTFNTCSTFNTCLYQVLLNNRKRDFSPPRAH
jgi:hypothetical protein|tara:strand:- start:377 stop:505 length:129 start_codon:yes stop_codon:yes gene_type:complete